MFFSCILPKFLVYCNISGAVNTLIFTHMHHNIKCLYSFQRGYQPSKEHIDMAHVPRKCLWGY